VNALGMETFINGAQPFSRAVDISEIGPDAPLLRPGIEPDLSHVEGGLRSHVATGPGWTLVALRRRAGTAYLRMGLRPDDVTGRLMLLHSPAGTGKTTALRALAHAGRDWCRIECVIDPETLSAEPGYLTSVALGEARPGEERRWRLLVLEDCDELVRAEAEHDSGQALSRLLNLTDGLLGQGLDVLVCLTTNEEVTQLHPAVVRPGRCLAEIEFGLLPPAAAAAWLGRDGDTSGIEPDGVTIAELYRRQRGHVMSAPAPTSRAPG
jgi:ATPases of the AAA+ class